MRKLALNLEHLEVESFYIEADLLEGRGTVRGWIDAEVDEPIVNTDPEVCAGTAICTHICSVSCPPYCTLGCTLAAGCSTLCDITRAYTCPRSCGYIICIPIGAE